MSESPLVSVIVPVFNTEKYIQRSINSILQQAYQSVEIVVVNDGSIDGSQEKLDQLALMDDRIVVISQKNTGVTAARLNGVRCAQGEYIGFVDSDDYIEPDMYDHLISNALLYHADISHCGYQMVFPSRVDYYYNTGCLAEQDKSTGLKELLTGSRIEPGLCNKLFHKALFHSLLHDSVMDLSIKNTEDWLMNFYLFREATKSVYEDFCPYHYMVRGDSAANQSINPNQIEDPLKVVRIIKNEIAGNSDLRRICERHELYFLTNAATYPVKQNPELIRPIQNEYLKQLRSKIIEILHSDCDKSWKIRALWVAVSPHSYSGFRWFYNRITGKDKKYEIS